MYISIITDNGEIYAKDEKLCCGYQLVSYRSLKDHHYQQPICANNEIVNGSKGK